MRSTMMIGIGRSAACLLLALGRGDRLGCHRDRGRPSGPADTGTMKSEFKLKRKLTDLQPGVAGPLDRAEAELEIKSVSGTRNGQAYASTLATLKIKGVDRAAEGAVFGAHLHVGPCVPGDGAAAGPHYNVDVITGAPVVREGPRAELWLDVTITDKGEAESASTVGWVPQSGQRSLVLHADPTSDTGAAGARQVCLPVKL